MAAEKTLTAAAAGTGIDWTLLAAIGIRESGFVENVPEVDGAGVGIGVFQITVSGTSGVTAAQAGVLAWSAHWGAEYLAANAKAISQAIPGLSANMAMWSTAASWNTGAQGQINRLKAGQSPDYHTAPFGPPGPNRQYHNDYGSNVLDLQDCFN